MKNLFQKKWVTIVLSIIVAGALIANAVVLYLPYAKKPQVNGLSKNDSYLTGEKYGKVDSVLFNTFSEGGFKRTAHIVSGGFPWEIGEDTIKVAFDAGAWSGIYYASERKDSYSVSVNSKILKTGVVSEFPKYGIYAYYIDADNFIIGMVDPNNKVFATFSRLDGKDGSWNNSPLDFVDFEKEITIKAVRIKNELRFYVNGIQVQKRKFDNLREANAGLIAEGMEIEYSDFAFSDADTFDRIEIPERKHGWGFAQNGVPNGSGFEIKSASHVVLNNLSPIWPSIWYGSELSKNYEFSVDLKELKRGDTSEYQKYGVYAGFEDNENYVAVFLDAKNKCVASYALINGKAQEWQNTAVTIDPKKNNRLKVIRGGDIFAFYLNGQLLHTRKVPIGKSQPGLLSESTNVEYSHFTVSKFSGFEGVMPETKHNWGASANGTLASSGFEIASNTQLKGKCLGPTWGNIWLQNSKSKQYEFSADISCDKIGKTSKFPKYGVYAAYIDNNNYFRVMLDPVYKVIATGGVLNGKELEWVNTQVDIDFSSDVQLKIVRKNNNFKVIVNDFEVQNRTIDIGAGEIGLVIEDCETSFDNIIYKK